LYCKALSQFKKWKTYGKHLESLWTNCGKALIKKSDGAFVLFFCSQKLFFLVFHRRFPCGKACISEDFHRIFPFFHRCGTTLSPHGFSFVRQAFLRYLSTYIFDDLTGFQPSFPQVWKRLWKTFYFVWKTEKSTIFNILYKKICGTFLGVSDPFFQKGSDKSLTR